MSKVNQKKSVGDTPSSIEHKNGDDGQKKKIDSDFTEQQGNKHAHPPF
jgi:hypothetical protein